MVTKRTRLLSIIATALMLVSMFACFVIPASAEEGAAALAALKAKYEALDPANFADIEEGVIEAAIAEIDGYIESYNNPEYEAMKAEIVAAAEEYAAGVDASLNGKVKAEAEIRYAHKAYYEALGFPVDATLYLISEVEDWKAISAANVTFTGVTLKVTKDIDFSEAGTLAPLVPSAVFAGTLDGQGHKLINLNVAYSGTAGAAVCSQAGGSVIKNLGLEGGSFAYTASGSNPGGGSFIGIAKGATKLMNCWSTMNVTGNVAEGKSGLSGLVGWTDGSWNYIDGCFFAGSVTNTAGAATGIVGCAQGANQGFAFNCVSAGTLNGTSAHNPAAMMGRHVGSIGITSMDAYWLKNSYAVGYHALRSRSASEVWGNGTINYYDTGELLTVETIDKYQGYKTLVDAVYLANKNWVGDQQEQTYYFDIVDGKLCFTTDADALIRKITIVVGDDEIVSYQKAGTVVNLVDDLGLEDQIEEVIMPEGYEDAIDAEYNLTVPNTDITIEVEYDAAGALAAAKVELQGLIDAMEAIDPALFNEEADINEWMEYANEVIESENVDDVADAILWRSEIALSLKDGAYPPFADYEAYKNFNTSGKWGITEAADWLYAVNLGVDEKLLNLEFHLTDDIDFGADCEPFAPLMFGGAFSGKIYGHGHAFYNVNITAAGGTDNGVGLIAKSGTVTLDNLGIASGLVTSTMTSTYGGPCAAFIGYMDVGIVTVNRCWNGATVKAPNNKYSIAGALVGWSGNNTYGPDLRVNGFYNVGTIDAGTGAGSRAGVIHAMEIGHGHSGAFNVFNAGELKGTLGGWIVSYNYGAGNVTRNIAGTSETMLNRAHNTGTTDSPNWAGATVVADYESGEIGYVMNKGTDSFTGKNSFAGDPVYFTLDDNGAVVFGTEANQIRKVTITGAVNRNLYVVTGAEVDLAEFANAEYAVTTEGYASALNGKVLTMPAADLEITATGDVVDLEAYVASKADLEALTAQIALMDASILANGDAITALKGEIDAALAADAAESTNDTKNAIIVLALEAGETTFALAEGKYVPYSKKDTVYAAFNANSNYGIYEAADWIAATNALKGNDSPINFFFMNDIVFDGETNIYPLCYGANYTGTIDGQGHVIKNILIQHERTTDAYHSVALVSRGGAKIKNLGIASGLIYGTGTNAAYCHVAGFLGDAGGGALIENCWNGATIKSDFGKLGNSDGVHVAGIIAKANNSATIKNCFNVGSIEGTVHASGLIGGAGALYTANNLINIGSVTASTAAAVGQHSAGHLSNPTALPQNSYSVGVPFYAPSNGGAWGDTTMTMDEYNAAHAAESAGEAAHKVNAAANGAVYYKLDNTYGLAFGTANNCVRKITISGTVNRVLYVNNGTAIDLAEIADADYVVETEGYESALAGKVLTVPAADITITASGDAIDLESYNTGKAALAALTAKLAAYDLTLFADSAAITEFKGEIDAALAADAAESTNDTKNAIIVLALEAGETTFALAEGKYVPYSKKDTVYADVAANGKLGIYDAADWAAFVAAGGNNNVKIYLMNDVTLGADAPIFGASTFGGTFDGNNNTLTVNVTATVANGQKFGIFGNGGSIKNLKIAGSVAYTIGTASSPVSSHTYAAIVSGGGAGVENVTNDASLTVEGYGANRMWIATMTGEVGYAINCTNNGAINFTGFSTTLAVGGIIGRTNATQGVQGCVNNGTITVTDTSTTGNYCYVGGIAGTTAGHNSTNVTNNGDIIVNSGRRVYVGGIQSVGTDSNENWLYGNILNTGDITVNLTKGGDACYVGGIFGHMMWRVDANATVKNTGDINVNAASPANGYMVSGITNKISALADEAYTAAVNEGNIWIGGVADENAAVADQITKLSATLLSGTASGSITYCDHSDFASEDDFVNVVVNNSCNDCAYTWTSELVVEDQEYLDAKATLAGIVAKFDGLKADLFTNGDAITAALNGAKAALAADEAESTPDTVAAIKAEAAKEAVVPALKEDAKVPYATKALYAEYGASTTAFGIYTTADWIKLTEDFNGKACSLNLFVMNDIDFADVENMIPLAHNGTHGLMGVLDGQGYTFKNITITQGATTNARCGIALVSAMNGGIIKNLGLTGTVTNTAEANTVGGVVQYTAAFVGGKHNGAAPAIQNCWADVHVKGPSNANGTLGVFFSYTQAEDSITNCINYGTVEATSGKAFVFYGYGANPTVKNGLDLGTGATASFISHANGVTRVVATNTWSVNNPTWSLVNGTPASITLPDGTVAGSADAVNAYYCVGSAAEAAWKATNGANGEVYYKADAVMGAIFGTATDRVQKVEFVGDATAVYYVNNGSTITLADVSAEDGVVFTVNGEAIDGATYTVPNADVTITVTLPETECEHNLGETVHIEGTNTHKFVCGECGETVGEPEACSGLVWTEDTDTKTHSATCAECKFVYTEDCVGTEKSDPTDCTKDHWYEYECDRENETIVDSGADAHVWGDWTTEGATEGYRRHDCDNCEAYEEELLPLAAPVIVITANEGKAGATGVEFTVTLTEAAVKGGTITITLPEWAKNVNLVAGANVSIDGLVATITGDIAAGSVLLTGTYDIDTLAGEAGVITATAANVLNEREEAVTVAVATADATIDVILGDAKVDGVINLIDAIAVLRASVGLDLEVNEYNADVNGDNVLTADDAVLIVRFWLGDPTYNGPVLGE